MDLNGDLSNCNVNQENIMMSNEIKCKPVASPRGTGLWFSNEVAHQSLTFTHPPTHHLSHSSGAAVSQPQTVKEWTEPLYRV